MFKSLISFMYYDMKVFMFAKEKIMFDEKI